MATISNTGVPGSGNGILMPMLRNRFSVQYISAYLSDLATNGLSQQTVNFKVDFIKGTISFDVEQPVAHPEMIQVLTEFNSTKNQNQIKVTMLDGAANELGAMLFAGLKTVDHKIDFDYTVGTAVTHRLVMLYGSVTHTSNA